MPERNEPEMAQGGRIQAGEKHEKTVRSHEPALAKVLDGAWAEDDHAVLSDALPKNDAGVRPPEPLFPWMPAIPFFFLGLGLYRAWIEIAFVTPIFSFPAAQVATHDACDIVMSVTLLLCAVFSRRLGPLFGKKWFYAVTVALMLLATVLLPISAFFHSFVVPLGWVAVLAGGVGTAFVILLWSELYGCLNPFRVALYYSGSLVIAAAVILLCRAWSLRRSLLFRSHCRCFRSAWSLRAFVRCRPSACPVQKRSRSLFRGASFLSWACTHSRTA